MVLIGGHPIIPFITVAFITINEVAQTDHNCNNITNRCIDGAMFHRILDDEFRIDTFRVNKLGI